VEPIDDPSEGRARPNATILRLAALIAVIIVAILWFGRDEPSQRLRPRRPRPTDLPSPPAAPGTATADTPSATRAGGALRRSAW
jgi:hypothetical protein